MRYKLLHRRLPSRNIHHSILKGIDQTAPKSLKDESRNLHSLLTFFLLRCFSLRASIPHNHTNPGAPQSEGKLPCPTPKPGRKLPHPTPKPGGTLPHPTPKPSCTVFSTARRAERGCAWGWPGPTSPGQRLGTVPSSPAQCHGHRHSRTTAARRGFQCHETSRLRCSPIPGAQPAPRTITHSAPQCISHRISCLIWQQN